jgi:hypothetical protein
MLNEVADWSGKTMDWFESILNALISQFVLKHEQDLVKEDVQTILEFCETLYNDYYRIDLTNLVSKFNIPFSIRCLPSYHTLVIQLGNNLYQAVCHIYQDWNSDCADDLAILVKKYTLKAISCVYDFCDGVIEKCLDPSQEPEISFTVPEVITLEPILNKLLTSEFDRYVNFLNLETRFGVLSKLLDILQSLRTLPQTSHLQALTVAASYMPIRNRKLFEQLGIARGAAEPWVYQQFPLRFVAELIRLNEEPGEPSHAALQSSARALSRILKQSSGIKPPSLGVLQKVLLSERDFLNATIAQQTSRPSMYRCIGLFSKFNEQMGGISKEESRLNQCINTLFPPAKDAAKKRWPALPFLRVFLGLMMVYLDQDEDRLICLSEFQTLELKCLKKQVNSLKDIYHLQHQVLTLLNCNSTPYYIRLGNFCRQSVEPRALQDLLSECRQDAYLYQCVQPHFTLDHEHPRLNFFRPQAETARQTLQDDQECFTLS